MAILISKLEIECESEAGVCVDSVWAEKLDIDLLQWQFKSENLKIECESDAGVCVDAVWAEEGLAPREGDPRLQG